MAGTQFLQAGSKYKEGKDAVAGWYVTEKLRGVRCFWDGGLSRDKSTYDVPWANIAPGYRPVATGLWTRYGRVLPAPSWFLNQLPPMPLDGLLHCEDDAKLYSAVLDGKDWGPVEYAVFDSPSLAAVFQDREIKLPGFQRKFEYNVIQKWINSLDSSRLEDYITTPPDARFEAVLVFLQENLESQGRVYLHRHVKLPGEEEQAQKQMNKLALKLSGLVVRSHRGVWEPGRVRTVLEIS